jgi:exosome complex component RRP42
VDFELPDYWDEGEVLGGRERWPVCITLNIAVPPPSLKAPCAYYLDAIPQEEAATPLRLLLVFSFPPASSPNLQAMRILGSGELETSQIRDFIAVRPFDFYTSFRSIYSTYRAEKNMHRRCGML